MRQSPLTFSHPRLQRALGVAEFVLYMAAFAGPAGIAGHLAHNAWESGTAWALIAALAAAMAAVVFDRLVVLRSSARLDISDSASHPSESATQELGRVFGVAVERVVPTAGSSSEWRHTGRRKGVLLLGRDSAEQPTTVVGGSGHLLATGLDAAGVVAIDAVASITAHELGHGAMDHVRKVFAVHCLTPLWALPVLGASAVSGAAGAVSGAVCMLLAVRTVAWVNQRFELQADRFGASIVSAPVMAATLDSLHHLTEDPTLTSEVFGSHPSLARRVTALQQA